MIDESRLLTNKTIPPEQQPLVNEVFAKQQPLLAVIGDLGLDGSYYASLLLVGEDKLAAFDPKHPGGYIEIFYSDILSAEVKRLYGNLFFYAYVKTGEDTFKQQENTEGVNSKKRAGKRVEILRSTYAAANVCDAAAQYINARVGYNVNDNTIGINPYNGKDKLESAAITYKKEKSLCPKCGRKLPSPDAKCMKCAGKKTLALKLAVYLKPKLGLLTVAMVISLVTTATALAPPYLTKILVDTVIPKHDKTVLLWVVGALAGIYLVQYALGAVRGYMFRVVGDTFVTRLKKDVYEKAQYLTMKFYDKASTGSVMNRINSDTANIQAFVIRIAQEAITQVFTLFGIIAVMMVMDWQLTLLSLIPVPFVVLLSRKFGHMIGPMYRRVWRRGSALWGILADTIPGVRVIKTFGGEERSIRRFGNYADELMREDINVGKIASVYPTIITFLISLGSLAIWMLGGTWVIDGSGRLTLGLLMSFLSYTGMFYGPVWFFASLNDSYQNVLVSVEKVMEILEGEPESNFGKGNILPRMAGKIEFRNVNFSFDRSHKVINDASFVIEPGDIVGIVGTTGAGKTTLFNLLMRFYEDYEGEILVDDVNIKDIDIDYFRSQIGYVQQEPMMFRDTVYQNIAYADPSAHLEQVLMAADTANAHPFISKLPDGYDTYLGERGVGLSGGERQRISIARAILRNPGLLMFDEATSAVDSETEKLIQDAIEHMIQGRTTLMIAHRLSTLRKANKIIVVDKGKIIEFGSPEELMALKGKYYKLIEIQTMSEKTAKMRMEERFDE